MEIPWDHMSCQLRTQRDVVSDTVRVFAQATVSLAGDETARVREILEA